MKSPGWSEWNSLGSEDSDLAMWERANTGKMAPVCPLHGSRILHRENGDYSSSPRPEVMQLSLSLYVTDVSRITVPPSEPRVSACEQVCVRTLEEDGWVSCRLLSQSDVVGVLLPGSGTPGKGGQCEVRVPRCFGGNLCGGDILPYSQLPHAGMGPARSMSLPIL